LNGIAYGVIAGVISYILLNPFFLRKISGGRIAPENYGNSERWVISPGSIFPFWVRKLLGSTEAEDNCLDFEARQTSRTGTEPNSMIGKAGSRREVVGIRMPRSANDIQGVQPPISNTSS